MSSIKVYIEIAKTILIVVIIIAVVWVWKDYQFQRYENKRQSENISSIRKMDSLRFANQLYTKKEIDEYLEYSRKDLQEFLKKNEIKTRRIEKIISQKINYNDDTKNRIPLSPVLSAINNKESFILPFSDSTKCMSVKGFVVFDGDSLSLDVTNRDFKNRSDVVSYWERNQWKFLGIKTRLFGKRVATVIVKDECGHTETFTIEKRKRD